MTHASTAEAWREWTRSLEEAAQGRRRERLDGLKTPADVAAWAADLRAWYRGRVGPLLEVQGEPVRQFHGRIDRDGYHIEKWLFEAMPGTLSAANMYVPARPNAAGLAVLLSLGHWGEGKSQAGYQRFAGYMARNGVPVLIYDHSGVGERREFWDPVRSESRAGKTPTSEHNRVGDLCVPAGVQPVRFFISEAAAARDLLASFPFVKRERIGITGVSGGGTMSRYAAAYLGDLAFSIPVCIVRGEGIGGGSDAEQACWGAGVRGVAAVDVLATICPRPAMLVTETAFDETAKSYKTLRRLYDLAGAPPEATEFFPVDDIHGYTHPMIEAVYRFLARNFGLPPAEADTWKYIRVLPDPATWVCPGGLIYRDRPQATLLDQLKRVAPPPAGDLTRERLLEVLRIADWKRCPVPYALEGSPGKTIRVTGSDQARPGELGLIHLPEDHPPDFYFIDDILYKGVEAHCGRSLLHFDRNLLGVRVRQILDFLADHGREVEELAAEDYWSVPLAFAAALAPAGLLKKAVVTRLPAGFRGFLDADLYTRCVGMMPTGLLAHGDMDDVIALAGERLTVLYRTDADGRVVRE